MTRTLIYSPAGEVGPAADALSPAPRSLAGLRIVVLDNGKPGARRLLSTAAEELARRVGARFVGAYDKGSAATPCEDDVLRELVEGADLVVTGTAD